MQQAAFAALPNTYAYKGFKSACAKQQMSWQNLSSGQYLCERAETVKVAVLPSERTWIITIHVQCVFLSIPSQCCFFQNMLGKCFRANWVLQAHGSKWLLMQFVGLKRTWKAKVGCDLQQLCIFKFLYKPQSSFLMPASVALRNFKCLFHCKLRGISLFVKNVFWNERLRKPKWETSCVHVIILESS